MICVWSSWRASSAFWRASPRSISSAGRATPSGRSRAIWLLTAGTATGCGIWATHFVAMLAYEPGFPTAYSVGLTVLSLVAAIVVTSVGSWDRGRRCRALERAGRRRPRRRRRRQPCTTPACRRCNCPGISSGRPTSSSCPSCSGSCSAPPRWLVRGSRQRPARRRLPPRCCSRSRSSRIISPPWARSRSCPIRRAPSTPCRSRRSCWRWRSPAWPVIVLDAQP